MNLERSKEWWVAMACSEPDVMIRAGVPPHPRFPRPLPAMEAQARVAFGKFMNFMRRGHGLSYQMLRSRPLVSIRRISFSSNRISTTRRIEPQ